MGEAKEIKHTFVDDELFCTVCGVNRRYWLNTLGGPKWCIENKPDEKPSEEQDGIRCPGPGEE